MISYLSINNIDRITNSFINKNYLLNEFNNNPYAKCLILEEDNQVIGYLYYSDIYERLEINQIEIKDSKRSNGNATKLLNYLIKNSNKDITLEVRIDNKEAIGLYKKFDFVEISIRKGYYKGIDGILMERKVIR